MSHTSEAQRQANMERLASPYPGRGIVIGKLATEPTVVHAYWVMGRSENSRNRVLIREGDIVRTDAFDPSKVTDPTNIIYTAMATAIDSSKSDPRVKHIVSNGNQTDTVVGYIQNGSTFSEALATRTYEDDEPNYTARITGMTIAGGTPATAHNLTVISRAKDGSRMSQTRRYMDQDLLPGTGACVHTYDINQAPGQPLPSFYGKPFEVNISGETVEDVGQAY